MLGSFLSFLSSCVCDFLVFVLLQAEYLRSITDCFGSCEVCVSEWEYILERF